MAADRPLPTLRDGLVAVGGLVFSVGVIGFGFERLGESGSNGVALLLSAALLAGSIAILARGPWILEPGAVAASCVAAPALAFSVVAGDTQPSVSLAAFIAAAIVAALYFAGPSRGHTAHLAVLVLAGWIAALALTQNSFTFDNEFASPESIISDMGGISLVVGGAYLLVGWWLDRTGLRGMATPFLGVGAIALPAGSYAFVSDGSDLAGGLVGLVAGAVVTFVGAQSHRRGTLWAGLVLVGIAVFVIAGAIAPDGEDATVAYILLVLLGGGLAYGARYINDWIEQLGSHLDQRMPAGDQSSDPRRGYSV